MSALLLASVLVLKGATVHTAAGPAIPNGVVVIDGGKIAAVGGPGTPIPAGATVVDASGRHVAPAFFAPASLVGLVEIQAVRATNDVSEIAEINPEARPDVAMNLDSETLPVTRSNGVLFAALAPRGSTFPGAASVVTLNGWTREDACVKCPAAVLVEWPEMAIDRRAEARPSARVQERRRDEALDLIRRTFRDAAAYRAARAAEGKAGVPAHDTVAPTGRSRPCSTGRSPSSSAPSARRRSTRRCGSWTRTSRARRPALVILGGYDAPKSAAALAERKIPVILDTVLELPMREDEPYDAPFTKAAELAKAGVVVAIGNGQTTMAAATTRDLPNHAAMAVVVRSRPARGAPRRSRSTRRGSSASTRGSGRSSRARTRRSPCGPATRSRRRPPSSRSTTRALRSTSPTATSASGSATATGRSRRRPRPAAAEGRRA